MKLLLTSNGFIGNSLENDFLELVGNKKGLRVAIIPTASDPIEWVPEKEGDTSEKYIPKLTKEPIYGKGDAFKYFTEKGFDVIIVDLKEDKNKVKEDLCNVDIIFVGGGDANWLLDWAKKAELNTYLKNLLDQGVVYVGVSAGSSLVAPDIGLGWWNPDWTPDHIGFGIIDFVVAVHQDINDMSGNVTRAKEAKEKIQKFIEFPWKVYLLADGQAIKVDGDKVEHIVEGTKKSI